MSTQLIRSEDDGAVRIIRLDAQKTRNSLTMEFRGQLGEAVEAARADDHVRAVFLTAEGPTFCSGGDLNHLKTACDPWTVHRRFQGLHRWLVPLIQLDKPVVVGVNGHAVGGGMGLALSGDLMIASESARFMAGFFRLGAVPDIAMMYNLPRLIGMARAKNFIFSGGALTGAQAAEWGLAHRCVPDAELFDAGMQEARRLAEGPSAVMGLAKSLMARSFETPLSEMIAFEGFGQALAMSSPEFHEGLNAALEKRPADFAGAAERDLKDRAG